MAEDETTPPFPVDEPAPAQANKTTTSTTIETVETGKPKRGDESSLGGMSGRFWICFILAFGALLLPVLWIIGLMIGSPIDAVTFKDNYMAYLALGGIAIGTYMGQNKPKGAP